MADRVVTEQQLIQRLESLGYSRTTVTTATAAAIFVSALAGCASTLQIPKEVSVPVPVPCVKPEQLPERPGFMTDSDILAFDSYRRTWALWLDRALRQAYEAQLEAIAKGCSKIEGIRAL